MTSKTPSVHVLRRCLKCGKRDEELHEPPRGWLPCNPHRIEILVTGIGGDPSEVLTLRDPA